MDNTNATRTYIAIDLKSFYASAECVERGLNPLTTNLVVADESRTQKTICLAVSPSLKQYGIPGRPRLFEVIERLRQINYERKQAAEGQQLTGKSADDLALKANKNLAIDYITASPRMALYIKYSARIYQIYLKYFAPEDMHVYSIDEIFIDITSYLAAYRMSPHELTMKIVKEVLRETGITATAGIGSNLYLCKVAMDIVAKHIPADADGVRIAELDEMGYRQQLWDHKPLTDFWRVGRGTAKKLNAYGITTMGQLARQSVTNEELLYRLFGVNAELLIDHAWGWEPCTMEMIKKYRPQASSFVSGQVLQNPYNFKQARTVAREMADSLALDLVDKRLVTKEIVLTVGYDCASLTQQGINYTGPITIDYYGRRVPRHAHGTQKLEHYTSSSRLIMQTVGSLFDKLVEPQLLVRRISITVGDVKTELEAAQKNNNPIQLSLFTDYDSLHIQQQKEEEEQARERRMQEATLSIKKRYGKNALLRGLDFADGATTRERNKQIGGHKA